MRLTKIIIFITLCLIVIQVAVAGRLGTAGETVNSFSSQQQVFQEENELLEKKIATVSSLTQIALKAKEAGFIKLQPLYLTSEYPVALRDLNVEVAR